MWLICDVISCCILSYDMGKINVYDKIMIENQQEKKIWESQKFLHKSASKWWFRNGIHSLLSQPDSRECADTIYLM